MQNLDRGSALEAFLRRLARTLLEGPAVAAWGAASVEDLANRAAAGSAPRIEPAAVPVLDRCLGLLATQDDELAPCVASLLTSMYLTRSEEYVRRFGESFGERYGYGVICGPESGQPAMMPSGDVAVGVLLLGPHTHYPLHHHPAEELYHVVAGTALWRQGGGGWTAQPPGSTIHHPSWQPHATITQAEPLVCLYVWRGDLVTDAAFLPDS